VDYDDDYTRVWVPIVLSVLSVLSGLIEVIWFFQTVFDGVWVVVGVFAAYVCAARMLAFGIRLGISEKAETVALKIGFYYFPTYQVAAYCGLCAPILVFAWGPPPNATAWQWNDPLSDTFWIF
jgi:hypothetical protein